MTRELKLGLIVGFSVLLLVGILISDHLSQAHRDKVAGVLPDEASAVLPRERPELLDPVIDSTAQATPAQASPTPMSQDLALGPVVPPPIDAASHHTDSPTVPLPDPGATRLTSGPSSAPTETAPPIVTDPTIASGVVKPSTGIAAPGPSVTGNDQFIVINQGATPGNSADAKPADIKPADLKPAEVKTADARTDPARTDPAKTHVVKKGETLYKIAASYYGNGNSWKRIADANPGKIGRDGSVRQGVTLVIPAAARSAPAPTAIASKPEVKPPAPKPRPTDGVTRLASYTVKKGDTLGDISKSVLGTSKRWREILSLNQDSIDDEDDIRIGMVLKVPAG